MHKRGGLQGAVAWPLDWGLAGGLAAIIGLYVVMLTVVARAEASRQPLDDVREQIVTALKDQEARTIVLDRANQLLQALDSGEEFAAAAEAAGATVTGPQIVGRQDPAIDQSVLFQVFMADKPGDGGPVIGQVANGDGGYTVYALEAVFPGRPESIPLEQRDAGRQQLVQQSGGAVYSAFVESLYLEAQDDIEINRDLLAASDLLQ